MSEIYILDKKAKKLGATTFGLSSRKDKRFFVYYDGKIINFGSKNGKTYFDHKDDKKRDAWYARHSKIKDKNGKTVIDNKHSPSFWSSWILW